ncbi:MAG: hypothetical protein ACRD12_11710, partial [Acidimicrobiales bacterium]
MLLDTGFVERGRHQVVKTAETPDEAARLRREADLLDVAAHPGLVEVVDFADGSQPVLRTSYVGVSLAEGPPLEIDEVAGVAAAVASTLADLHDLGLVHAAVQPSHVLLDGDGRPVLCGLGHGGLTGERLPAGDGDGDGDEMLDPAGDVAGLGRLITYLVNRSPESGRGGAAEELRRIACAATASSAADRPSAHRVADDVHDSVPGARLPGRSAAPA